MTEDSVTTDQLRQACGHLALRIADLDAELNHLNQRSNQLQSELALARNQYKEQRQLISSVGRAEQAEEQIRTLDRELTESRMRTEPGE